MLQRKKGCQTVVVCNRYRKRKSFTLQASDGYSYRAAMHKQLLPGNFSISDSESVYLSIPTVSKDMQPEQIWPVKKMVNLKADRKRFWLGILTSLDNDQFLIF
jgi:hypothetical protein